ncbi:hypothetical protein MalM25_17490 [Planctomycetes bacterium MalM25]|nr:hypothetical protein MalM25_17490 [Planctomycetes bacterium MalM25]
MNQAQITRVQSTWSVLAPSADQVAMLFYDRLLEIAPEWKRRLDDDLIAQGKQFMPKLSEGVRLLRADSSPPTSSGDDKMTAALLWTIEKGLAEDFTDEVREAWSSACEALSLETLQTASPDAA